MHFNVHVANRMWQLRSQFFCFCLYLKSFKKGRFLNNLQIYDTVTCNSCISELGLDVKSAVCRIY